MFAMKERELAKSIEELREKLDLTQEQFAAKVGVTFSTVNRWENSKGTPSPLTKRRIEELQEEFDQSEVKTPARRKRK